MALYRQGEASMTAEGQVTGVGTQWREPLSLIRKGATIVFLTTPLKLAVINTIDSDTEMTAITTDGEAVAQSKYVILLNDSLTVDGMAQDVAETLRYYQSKETEIEEAIEFFKNFDLKTLQDLVARAEAATQSTSADRAATEQLKNETNQFRAEALNARDEAEDARDAADIARSGAEAAKSGADTAKAGAETARDQAQQWAQSVNPENLLHKDQNLADLTDKNASRVSLELDRIRQLAGETIIRSPDGKYLTINQSNWGYWDPVANKFVPLGIQQGGTGANSDKGSRNNLNVPVGNKAIAVPNNSNILSFIASQGESGFYSSGELITFGPPEVAGWWMYKAHVNGVNEQGHMIYGNIEATGSTGNKWGCVCDNGSFGPWTRISRSDNRLMITQPNNVPALGDYSIAIGDNDSGFAWVSDGNIVAMSDGQNIFGWTPFNVTFNKIIAVNVPDTERSFYVGGTRRGDSNAVVVGKVEGGGWDQWRERSAGLLVEAQDRDSAVAIWKAVRLGNEFISGMSTTVDNNNNYQVRLNVAGASFIFGSDSVGTAGQWISTSDIRLKAQLKYIVGAKEKVKSIKGCTYFKRNGLEEDEHSIYSEEAGVIAQDVQSVLPEAVYKVGGSDYLGVNYGGVTALLVNAINEMIDDSEKQNETIAKQKEEINALKIEVDEMKKAIEEMKALIVQTAK
ncbi:tail fiber protein [Citrobacter phage IME-JL8]|uniref:Tail fiber protein n=1 Tax=Citrobacter phage IME-JL8 TaxID=2709754 RepID=A0A6G6XT89_9CAUD|nr:tail fiber protein [Citrobacter phage IME-JL8]